MRTIAAVAAATMLAAGLGTVTSAQAADPPLATIGVDLPGEDGSAPKSGSPTIFTASLSADDAPLTNEPLELQVMEAGTSAFTTYVTATSDSNGNVVASTVLRYNARVRWHHPATANAGEAYSFDFGRGISAVASIRVNDRTPRPGQRLVVRGRVSPNKAGRVVRLFSGVDSTSCGLCVPPGTREPVLLARAVIAADGSYRLERVFKKTGRRLIFVVVQRSWNNIAGSSPTIRVAVRRGG